MDQPQNHPPKITLAIVMIWTAEVAFVLGMLRMIATVDRGAVRDLQIIMFSIWSFACIAHILLAIAGYATLRGPHDEEVKDCRALSATVAWCVVPILLWMMGCLVMADDSSGGVDRIGIFSAGAAHLLPAAIAIRWQLHRDRGQIHSWIVKSCRLVPVLVGLMPTFFALPSLLH